MNITSNCISTLVCKKNLQSIWIKWKNTAHKEKENWERLSCKGIIVLYRGRKKETIVQWSKQKKKMKPLKSQDMNDIYFPLECDQSHSSVETSATKKKQKNTPLFFSFPFCVFQTRTLFLWENYSFLADYRLNGTQEIMSNLRVENDFPIS